MRIAAFGRTRWLYDSIVSLCKSGHELVLIGTCVAAPEYDVTEQQFELLAHKIGCPFFCDASINNEKYIALVRSLKIDVAISVNWLNLIGAEMIGAFPHGIVNAHAGDLPRYRGNACPNWAILNGETQIVLTLHKMSVELDAGPVLLKRSLQLNEETYIGDVYRFLDREIPDAFVDVVSGLDSGMLIPVSQSIDPSHSLRCFPRMPSDSEIVWELPAKVLARIVRASSEPFSGAFTTFNGTRLTVWRARADVLGFPYLGVSGQVVRVDNAAGEVWVLAEASALILQEVEFDGVRRRASDVIRTTRIRLGGSFQGELEALKRELAEVKMQIASAQRGFSDDR